MTSALYNERNETLTRAYLLLAEWGRERLARDTGDTDKLAGDTVSPAGRDPLRVAVSIVADKNGRCNYE